MQAMHDWIMYIHIIFIIKLDHIQLQLKLQIPTGDFVCKFCSFDALFLPRGLALALQKLWG